jgi:hypothetical protein
MKSCRRESFKTCTISSRLISIPSNSNKWKVQTYFYVTISILVNSYILNTLFDNFPINARTHNPRQWETMGQTEISYHRHIPNERQTYRHKSQDVQELALKWSDCYLPGHVWKCRHKLIRSLKYLPIFISVETQKCLQCDTDNARTTTIQARELNMLFLFEKFGFLSSNTLFFFSKACKSARRKQQQKCLLCNRTRRNYTGFVKVNEAKVVSWCTSASCIELVADGVQWRNFAIKVKILQVLVMTRNFHNNSKEDFVPYWFDVAVTGVHVILILTSLLSGLMRH